MFFAVWTYPATINFTWLLRMKEVVWQHLSVVVFKNNLSTASCELCLSSYYHCSIVIGKMYQTCLKKLDTFLYV